MPNMFSNILNHAAGLKLIDLKKKTSLKELGSTKTDKTPDITTPVDKDAAFGGLDSKRTQRPSSLSEYDETELLRTARAARLRPQI